MNKGRTIVVDNIVYPKIVEEAVIDRKTGKSLYEKLKNVDNEIRQGSSTERPVLTEEDAGNIYFDIDLNMLIIWNGTAWQDTNSNLIA